MSEHAETHTSDAAGLQHVQVHINAIDEPKQQPKQSEADPPQLPDVSQPNAGIEIPAPSQEGRQEPKQAASMTAPADSNEQEKGRNEIDSRSVFLENVHYETTTEQLADIFGDCGKIVRVTILKDKMMNKPRGLAYIEFEDIDSTEHAIYMTGTEHRGRAIRVTPKRTNIKSMIKQKKKNLTAHGSNNALQHLLGFIHSNPKFSNLHYQRPRP